MVSHDRDSIILLRTFFFCIGDVINVMVDVTNNCSVATTDVVQIYLVDPPMTSNINFVLVRYWSRLIGFEKVYLNAGETKSLTIPIRFDDVAIFINEQYNQMEIISGIYTVRVGYNSRNTVLYQDIHL